MPRPSDDAACVTIENAVWYGWMVARGMEMLDELRCREESMRILDVPYSEPDLSDFDIGDDGMVRRHRR